MLRKLIFACMLAAVAFTANAQDEEEPKKGFDKEKVFFGGSFGLSFGNYTLINVSPQVGYRFNKNFAAGTGINFSYSSYKNYGVKQQYGVAGLNIFGRFYPFAQGFVQAQPEVNYTWGKLKYDTGGEAKLDGKFVPSMLVGVGAALPVGGRGAFLVMLQYDLLQNDRSPYGKNAFISIGYNF